MDDQHQFAYKNPQFMTTPFKVVSMAPSCNVTPMRQHIKFKPASHRTSLELSTPDVKEKRGPSPYHRKHFSPYKSLPKDLLDAIIPLRKDFSPSDDEYQWRRAYRPRTKVTSQHPKSNDDTNTENQASSNQCHFQSSTDSLDNYPHQLACHWMKRVEQSQARLNAAKIRCSQLKTSGNRSTSCFLCAREQGGDWMTPQKASSPPAGIRKKLQLDDEESSNKSVKKRKMVPLIKNSAKDFVVLVNEECDRAVALECLIEKATLMRDTFNTRKESNTEGDKSKASYGQADRASGLDNIEDLYIDDDMTTSKSLRELSEDASFYSATCDDLLFRTGIAMNPDGQSAHYSDSSACVHRSFSEDTLKDDKVMTKDHFVSTIEIHANFTGTSGEHLVAIHHENVRTGATKTLRRVISASAIQGLIEVSQ